MLTKKTFLLYLLLHYILVSCQGQISLKKIAEIKASGETITSHISIWRTTFPFENIVLPLRNGYNYNFTVDWGDGTPVQRR